MQAGERPRLRPGLKFVRHENDAGVSWVVKDPATRKYFRFGQVEAWLMQQMDGTRSLQDICDALLHEVGLSASPTALDVLVRRLKELGLAERSVTERSAMLVEHLRTGRRIRRETDNTFLRMRFSFGDPDALLSRMVRRMGFFWTRGFVVASIAIFAAYVVIVAAWWGPFSSFMVQLYNPASLGLPVIILSYGVFTAVSVVHEFGHGLTCKRFGGDVHELGAMLLYFTPSFYCNISDAWMFEKRSHRLWVTFAGGWIELWVAAVAAIVWLLTEPGTAVNVLAALTSATAGALALLLNYNPLIPLDGYYALVDWLEMPNLRGRSFRYVGALAKRHVLRLDVAVPEVTPRERRVFILYGVTAVVYSASLIGLIGLFVARLLVVRLGLWGAAIVFVLLFSMTRRPRAGLAALVRRLATETLPRGPRRQRAALAAGAAAVVLALAAAATPWTVRTPATVLVEPAARLWLRPALDARLVEVRAAEGGTVLPGDTVAILVDPDLELERVEAAAAVDGAARRASAARALGDAAVVRAAELEGDAARAQLSLLDAQRSGLVLVAPVRGVVATPLLDERVGDVIRAGEDLVEIWEDGPLRARLVVPASRGGEIRPGTAMRVRFPAHPGATWHAVVASIEPAAGGAVLHAIAELPESPDFPLYAGMVGRGKVDITRTTVAGAAARTFYRLKRLDLLL
ncbi:MAG TPA: HlyD family efflux transporter periplasmic adaptor subunit [Longimicrobiales bacterium]|nr:HlyD family efflux transporter periplasmic adaptor subunit [Longimicrobiales bacterium]